MKEEYYKDIFGGTKYGDYLVYGLDKSESNYSDLYNKVLSYYDIETEESKEERDIRLAKEKAEKRNNKIDQLLGE
jgi:hypothetical protein